MERAGIPTRFPHPSNVYRVFLSKDWMAHLCLQPGLRCPATTKVNRASVETDPQAAAANALKSLDLIRKVQRGNNREGHWAGRGATEKLGAPDASTYDPDSPVPWDKVTGVTKLGFSWEAADVKKFSGVDQLAARLRKLFDQPQVSHIEKVKTSASIDLIQAPFPPRARLTDCSLPLPTVHRRLHIRADHGGQRRLRGEDLRRERAAGQARAPLHQIRPAARRCRRQVQCLRPLWPC